MIEADTEAEWKKIQKRDCVFESHGGLGGCGAASKQTLEWYYWIREKKSWDSAKANCENLDAKLLSRINGTEEQLLFFIDKLLSRDDQAWLGDIEKGSLQVRTELPFFIEFFITLKCLPFWILACPIRETPKKLSLVSPGWPPYLAEVPQIIESKSICEKLA